MLLVTMLLAAVAVVLAVLLFVLLRRSGISSAETERLTQAAVLDRGLSEFRSSLKDQTLEISKQLGEIMGQNTRFFQETHQGYQQSVSMLQHRVGELQEATRAMVEIGKDISSLQDILQAPKMRGGLGELILGEVLKQILPEEHYALQYSFRSGVIVDAVVKLAGGMIPVDAKFPLENFKRILESGGEDETRQARKNFIADVKKHIDAIAGKYILPEEGTFDFALMYIPAENIYYEIIIKDEIQAESLSAYALRKRVVPVSPNSFYAYLQAIVRGLKGLRIEHSARMILENLAQLEMDFGKLIQDFEKVGSHLSNAQSAYAKAEKRMGGLRLKISSVEAKDEAGMIRKESVEES